MSDYTPRRAVLLARISEAENGDEHGVTGQVKRLRGEAVKLGWEIRPDETHVLIENDTSAFQRYATCPSCMQRGRQCTCPPLPGGRKRPTVLRTWRPEFRRALALLKSGEVDGLLVLDLDRAVRDPRDLEDLIDVTRDRAPDIAVDSVTGSLRELHTSTGVQTARILMGVAVKSSEDTGRRVATARQTQAAAGWYGGGVRPFGYRLDPDAPKFKKTLIVDEDEAAEIRQMADQLLTGASLRSVAADLRKREVPTVKGGHWDTATVRDILLRPTIAGLAVHGVRDAARGYRRRGETVPVDAGVTGKTKWPAILGEDSRPPARTWSSRSDCAASRSTSRARTVSRSMASVVQSGSHSVG
jgi:DNA invertase Pin-like site-specific DNA recombinase